MVEEVQANSEDSTISPIDISSLMILLVSWFVKLIDMQNNTQRLRSLAKDQKLFNENQLIMKKYSSYWES